MPQRPGILVPASTFERVALASCQLHGIEPWSFGWTLFCLIPAGHTGASWSWRPRPTRRSRLRGKLRSKVGQRARGAADDLAHKLARTKCALLVAVGVVPQPSPHHAARRPATTDTDDSPPRSGPSHSRSRRPAAGRTGRSSRCGDSRSRRPYGRKAPIVGISAIRLCRTREGGRLS